MRKQASATQYNMKYTYSYLMSANINEAISSPKKLLEEKEIKLSVRELINYLSNNRKQFSRLYLRGMSVEEICDLFKWDKTKIRYLLCREINDIKEKIKNTGDKIYPNIKN